MPFLDDLHFNPKYNKATIKFTRVEYASFAYMDIYDMDGCKILGGARYYADEFCSLLDSKDFKLIIVDIWIGCNSIMTTGVASEGNHIGDKKFSMVVDATAIEYTWI